MPAEEMRQNLPKLTTILHSFTHSPETFRIITSVPPIPPTPKNHDPNIPPKPKLFILDSSFNPPTLAHLHIATSALKSHSSPPNTSSFSSSRLLLLLSIQNADKAPQPASFPHRLVMMELFARDILSAYKSERTKSQPQAGEEDEVPGLAIDIGITKLPYFIDKASAISNSGIYESEIEQVHLIGFDTLIRLLDTKYYPPKHTLEGLGPFLGKHWLRVMFRTGDSEGKERGEQESFVRGIGEGSLDNVGGKREWREKIELVDVGMGEVSSTRVREAIRKRDVNDLEGLLSEGVREWVLGERLYVDE